MVAEGLHALSGSLIVICNRVFRLLSTRNLAWSKFKELTNTIGRASRKTLLQITISNIDHHMTHTFNPSDHKAANSHNMDSNARVQATDGIELHARVQAC
jgi:hypothetical protein